jgi:uncharacterized repeat protein (TIGR01451 family)
MKHRTFTEGVLFRIILAAALGVGILSLSGQTAQASVPARTDSLAASRSALTSAGAGELSPQCHADLSVTVSGNPNPVSAGGVLTYTLAVTNDGPDTAYTVNVTDTLPDGTTFQSLTAPGWNCTKPAVGAAGTITCSRASIEEVTHQIILTVNVAPDTPKGTVLTNTASVFSSYTDDNPANNTATATTLVTADTLTTIMSETPDSSPVGWPVTVAFSVAPAPPALGTPTGIVTVTDGVDSCTGTVAEGACSLTLTTPGERTLMASYEGDGGFNASVSALEPHAVHWLTFLVLVFKNSP